MWPKREYRDEDDKLYYHISNHLRPSIYVSKGDEPGSSDESEYDWGEPEIVEPLAVRPIEGSNGVEPVVRGEKGGNAGCGRRWSAEAEEGQDEDDCEGHEGKEDGENGEEDG